MLSGVLTWDSDHCLSVRSRNAFLVNWLYNALLALLTPLLRYVALHSAKSWFTIFEKSLRYAGRRTFTGIVVCFIK
jgi:hypothetical protein